MKKLEILAPAGGKDALIAAVRSGTNAVYLGAKDLNARRNASNFSDEELKEVVSYCHARDVKVYITLNTLISDDEIDKAISVIKCGCAIGADAFIIQDLGLYRLVKQTAPEIPIHASTQMSIQTIYGVDVLNSMGFSRVILPREMSLGEITTICKNTPLEVEVFVHGALCMCVSGQCYLSAMLGSRSGNRGLCAQPCRLPFAMEGGNGHDLSLKDLSIIDEIPNLAKAGVKSFKIEGRMKRPEYVAACVTACKESIENDGKVDNHLKKELKAVFSRSGFTKGYYQDKVGPWMFGIRKKQDVAATTDALSSLPSLYRKDIQTIPVDFALTGILGEKLSLSASSKGFNVYEESDFVVTKAQNKSADKDSIKSQLDKCGSTPFYANDIFIDIDDDIYLPVSAINKLRRSCLDTLEAEVSKTVPKKFIKTNISIPEHKAKNSYYVARFSNINQVPNPLYGIKSIVVPLFSKDDKLKELCERNFNVGVEIPRGIFSTKNRILDSIKKAKELGATFALCGNVDSIVLAQKAGLKVMGGFSLNVFNSLALKEYEKLGVDLCTLSPEITLQQAQELGFDIPRGLVIYGRIPLMLTRNCPARNARDCSECDHNAYLTDRLGVKFPIVCNNGFSELLNSRPIYMAERLKEIKNMDFNMLYFTKESTRECLDIIDKYKNGEKFDGEFTRGLYYRGVE